MPTTAEEQYLLELINEARLNPLGNAKRYISSFDPLTSADPRITEAMTYFGVNGQALYSALSALKAVGPLAWSDTLATAAERHSAAMIAANEQSHQVKGEADLAGRATSAGYTGYSRLGENVYAYAQNLPYAHAGFMVDWGDGPNGMQSPAGHRDNIMSAAFTEVGIDITAERDAKTDVGPYVVTQDFGARGKLFVTGVAYSDSDRNGFYTIGEGLSGLTISTGSGSATSSVSGGYSLALTAGAQTLTLSGAGLSGTVTVATTIGTENLKLDVVSGSTLLTSGSITVSGPINIVKVISINGASVTAGDGAQDLRGNDGNDKLYGGAGQDKLQGGAGNDELYGGADQDNLTGGAGDDYIDGGDGIDIAHYSGRRSEYTITARSDGSIGISGSTDGTDTVRNVEFFMFSDGQYSLADLGMPANYAPSVAATQAISTGVGVSKQFVVPATDRDGDPLTYTTSTPTNGTLTNNGNGTFVYSPTRGYEGADSFVVTVSDGKGGTASQTVTVTVKVMNEAPTVTATQNVSMKQDTSHQITVSARDPDGDAITYTSGAAGHGTVTGGNGGVFTYTPTKGYTGADSFVVTVSDGKGGTASQTVTVNVALVAPPTNGGGTGNADTGAPFRLFTPNGFKDTIGGTGTVTGTNGFQDITLYKTAGTIMFDGSFNRGGDIIRLPGNAGEYTASLAGSVVTLVSGGSSYIIPIGPQGASLVFGDGVRKLYFDETSFVAKIGSQTVTGSASPITAPTDNSPLPAGQLTGEDARLFLSTGATVTIGGDHVLFGTATGVEKIHYLRGDLQLDASFNKGGDTLFLPDAAGSYQAQLFGSTVVVTSPEGQITIPIGVGGMTLNFAGDERVLRIDPATNKVLLGDQEILLTSASDLDPADGGRLSIDLGSAASPLRIDLGEGDYTLTDDAHVDSVVVIAGFDRGDVIAVTGAKATDYNFTKADTDGDGRYTDLSITYREGSTNNLITVLDAFANNGAVYNAATAEAAVGHSFITFG